MTRTTGTCAKCDGKGTLGWTSLANGVCFACKGSGQVTADVAERRERLAHIKSNLEWMSSAAEWESEQIVEGIAQECARIADPIVTRRAIAALASRGHAAAAEQVARMVSMWVPSAA